MHKPLERLDQSFYFEIAFYIIFSVVLGKRRTLLERLRVASLIYNRWVLHLTLFLAFFGIIQGEWAELQTVVFRESGDCMGIKETNMKLLYQGNTLEAYLGLRGKLDTWGIPYDTTNKKNGSWVDFFTMIFFRATAMVGRNGEREMTYTIYVKNEDYQKVQQWLLEKK